MTATFTALFPERFLPRFITPSGAPVKSARAAQNGGKLYNNLDNSSDHRATEAHQQLLLRHEFPRTERVWLPLIENPGHHAGLLWHKQDETVLWTSDLREAESISVTFDQTI